MALKVRSFEGLITGTDAVRIAWIPDGMMSIGITLITLYNPNSAAVNFLLRKRIQIKGTDAEDFYIRFDESIPTVDSWTMGMLGRHIPLSDPESYYDVKLDSNPTEAIVFITDYVFEL